MLKKLLFLTLVLGLVACVAESPLTTRSTAPEDRGIERVPPAIIPTPTTAKKVALVIGNKKYQFGRLRNTVNDATDMARVLKNIGFEVILKTDLDQRGMDEVIDQFGVRLAETRGIGLFYFSGHGARAGGENYLLPINNDRIKKAKDLKYYALASSRVLETMTDAKTDLNIIVLDACRDNPFRSAGRTLNRGLSRMQSRGSIIAFATAEKDTASDISNNQRNGLFTSHLLAALTNAHKTHQRIDDMFIQVSQAVFRESGGQQEPWYNASWRAPFCFGGCSDVRQTAELQAEIERLRQEKARAEARGERERQARIEAESQQLRVVPPIPIVIQPRPQAEEGTHIVQEGEQLYAIARKYDKRFRDISAWNNIKAPFHLRIGQVLLLIPPETSVSKLKPRGFHSASSEYTVKPGDSFKSIAKRYGIAVDELSDWNGMAPPYTVYPGLTLKLEPPK